MRFLLIFLSVVTSFLGCSSAQKKDKEMVENIIYQPKDKEILDEVLTIFSNEKDTPTEILVVKVGTFFLGTPYVAHTLEMQPEQLVVNLREMDCTTFAENCLAISRTIKSGNPGFEQFTKELRNIRYRDGVINGYPSRLHYFSDWIYNNAKKKPLPIFQRKLQIHHIR